MKTSFIKLLSVFVIALVILSCEKEINVPVTSINLPETSLVIEVDSVATINANIDPLDASNKTLKWISSDTTIAKVSSEGIVLGISPGLVKITVESNNGYTETCKVNIIKIIEHNPVDEISFGASPFIAFDNNDNLWYGGYGGVYKMGFDGSGWRFYSLDTEVNEFDFDSDNNLWAATTTKGLLKFDGQVWLSFDTLNSSIPTNRISAICIDQNDYVWVGFGGNRYYNNKVGRFDGVQWKIYDSDESLISDYYVFRIIVDHSNNIWCSHVTGVSKFDGSVWELLINDSDIIWPNVLDIEEDIENSIWFASTNNGVFKYDGTNVMNYTTNNSSLYSDYIQSVGIDDKGNKWFGISKGVSRFDGEDWIHLTYPDFNIFDIRTIAIDSEGNKWFASTNKIYELND